MFLHAFWQYSRVKLISNPRFHTWPQQHATCQTVPAPLRRRDHMPLYVKLGDLNARPLLSIKKTKQSQKPWKPHFFIQTFTFKTIKQKVLNPKLQTTGQTNLNAHLKHLRIETGKRSDVVNSATRLCLVTPPPSPALHSQCNFSSKPPTFAHASQTDCCRNPTKKQPGCQMNFIQELYEYKTQYKMHKN